MNNWLIKFIYELSMRYQKQGLKKKKNLNI